MRQIQGLNPGNAAMQRFTDSAQGRTAQAIVGTVPGQIDALKQQQQASVRGLEQKGQSSVEQLRRLNALGEDVALRGATARGLWENAAQVADETVARSEMEVSRALSDLDNAAKGIGDNLDFAKAHDMQVAGQAILGSMRQAGDNVIRTHGIDSAEYQQFLATKTQSLALAQSQLQAEYGKLKVNIAQQTQALREQTRLGLQQFVGYNRQNRQNTLNAMAASEAQYAIQETQTMLGLEQMRMNVSNDLADFLSSMPTFVFDLQPLIMEINELGAEFQANLPAFTIGYE